MPPERPRLYLHIGRNKAGSTTIQAFCLERAEQLKAAGVQYALFGYPPPPGGGVPSFPSHHPLADFVRAQSGGAVLVSHEGICCFPAELTRSMASDLSDLDVRVIFYIRPYREWVVSSYSFDVCIGFNGRDFDRYLESLSERISFRPMLEIWGEVLGWDKIRVRSLHPADLEGGDLVTDFMAAMEVEVASPRSVERLNTGASWMTVELVRTVLGRDEALGWDPQGRTIARTLSYHLEMAVADHGEGGGEVNYLTRGQAQALAGLYNDDLAFIAERTGVRLQAEATGDLPDRRFLPSAERAPRALMRLVRQRASEPAAARLHPDVADFVNRPAFRAYCED